MPLQNDMKIISTDDHVVEHPNVWLDRLPAALKERGPQIIEDELGHHVWRYDGEIYPQIGLNAVAGKDPKEYGMEPVRYDDMIPGCYDAGERVKDMDIDGVEAALCFPSFPGFSGGVFQRAKDKDLALECVRAWNDFQVDEWCAAAPSRLIPLGLLPTWDPVACAREVERLATLGTKAISFPDGPVPLGLPSFHHPTHWEPLWDAVEAADIPLALHFGSGSFVPGFSFLDKSKPDPHAPFAVAIAVFATNSMWSTADLLLSGVLQRHPKLRFVLSEGGIGWIPYLLERIDYTWERHRWYQDIDKVARPSELFKKHFWGCFIDDFHGVDNRYQIGIENILIEVDYPHSDSNWPNSRKRIAENLVNVPDDEARMIVETNARALFKFPA
ncbi:amidohydrolase family protein [uncultured Jatrophihabitans sp.]|uniref:amidohydrolase family protein n=1 Tax=uncultured Jatrophihabitans sp. TaxID=1610747 RepID=UPI0035CA0D82